MFLATGSYSQTRNRIAPNTTPVEGAPLQQIKIEAQQETRISRSKSSRLDADTHRWIAHGTFPSGCDAPHVSDPLLTASCISSLMMHSILPSQAMPSMCTGPLDGLTALTHIILSSWSRAPMRCPERETLDCMQYCTHTSNDKTMDTLITEGNSES